MLLVPEELPMAISLLSLPLARIYPMNQMHSGVSLYTLLEQVRLQKLKVQGSPGRCCSTSTLCYNASWKTLGARPATCSFTSGKYFGLCVSCFFYILMGKDSIKVEGTA